LQKVVGQADSGLSQMTSVGGVDCWIAVGAYQDLEGDVNRRSVTNKTRSVPGVHKMIEIV
jgi:hypothetical protein